MQINELQDKKIAILGFGLEWQSTLNFLLENWVNKQNITLLDKSEISNNSWVEIVSGEEYLDGLSKFDIIIKSPGISPYHPKIFRYKDRLTSQVEIFFSNYKGKVIWVTATKGKSTTVTLLHKTLQWVDLDVKLVGNIWQPVLDEIDLNTTHDYVIYELSSYMLEWFKPNLEVGLLGNIFRCHVDWHNDDFDTYKQAKLNILDNAKHRITNINLISELKVPHVRYFGTDGDYTYKDNTFLIHGQEVMNDENIVLKWEHNRINIMWVIAIWDTLEIDNQIFIKSLKNVLKDFNGLPHRLEELWTFNDITFVDDSISTTPESTVEAIRTYEWKIGTLFLWWYEYGFEFENFWKFISEKQIKNIVFFPDTGDNIKKAIDQTWYEYNSIKTNSMEEAIKFAYENTNAWEIVLLSCASPSYSMYNNYKERGDDFKNMAEKLS